MDWRRAWDNATAAYMLDGTLSFYAGFNALCALRSANPPAEELRTRFLCVSDYWGSYR